MGLDLLVEGCARAGHEAEWRRILESSFQGDDGSDANKDRFREISVPPYERLGAPRVGHDAAADAWIVEARGATTPEETAAVLEEFHGYYVLRLVTSDGVPQFSHGGLYEGLDETSFRGSFLDDCGQVLGKLLIADAWNSKLPEAAVAYGRALLAAADVAAHAPPPPPTRGLLARLGLAKAPEALPLEEQLEIVQAAGRWYVFWGERGHAIRAWF